MKPIFHITSRAEAAAAAATGEYLPSGFATDGFIHCSYARQVKAVADGVFRGRADLIVFEIDPAALAASVVEENLEGGPEQFPHIYGPLPMHAVVRLHDFPCRSDGRFDLPAGLAD